MGALVAYQGCTRCEVAHCPHARRGNSKYDQGTQKLIGAVMVLLAAVVLGGTPAARPAVDAVREAVTRDRPPAPAPSVAWSAAAKAEIPGPIQVLYVQAADTCPALSPFLLAGIGRVESNHGKSHAPGVRSGLNRAGCCRGPMQFNTENGKGGKSTWDSFGQDNNGDGEASPYDPGDAIPAAARKLCANGLEPDDGNRLYKLKSGEKVEDPCPDVRGTPESHRALMRYNRACWYVRDVIHHGLRYAHEDRGVT